MSKLLPTTNNLLLKDGEMYYYPDFLDADASLFWFEQIYSQTPWEQYPIYIFGKKYLQPRLIAWYGSEDYSYSSTLMRKQDFPAYMLPLLHAVNEACGLAFNSVLLNLYRHGEDSMGWHSDNEPELGLNPVIASLSLGEARRFLYRNKQDKNLKGKLDLTGGSLLVMAGNMQHHWQHAIPKTTRSCGARINLTFRNIISG